MYSRPQYSRLGEPQRKLEISPAPMCRLWPYVKYPGCSERIQQCISHEFQNAPVLEGRPVGFNYTLAGGCPGARDTVENYAYQTLSENVQPFGMVNQKYCTNSVVQGGCRCDQARVL
jgi:hypothetical protein